MLTTRHNLSQDLLQDSFSRESLERSFNALIDASDALSLRMAITLTDIGEVLEQVTTMMRRYHSDGALLTSIQNSIQCIEEEDERRDLLINFCGLQNYRSTSSDYGASFLQRNRRVFLRTQKYLKTTHHLRNNAAAFIAQAPLMGISPP